MPAKQIVFAIVTFLHDLFTSIWIGGLITLGITVLPSARKVLGMGPQTKKLMDTIQKRLSVLVYVSIVGLILTGFLLSNRSPAFQGLFSFGNSYSTVLTLKHILVLAMVAVTLYRSLVLGRRSGPPAPSQEKLSAGLLFLNIVLGIAILLLSGFSAALGAALRHNAQFCNERNLRLFDRRRIWHDSDGDVADVGHQAALDRPTCARSGVSDRKITPGKDRRSL